MKKLFTISIFVLLSVCLYAQVPQAINFQAIARDGFGNPMINTNIQIRLSVIDSSLGGSTVYQELRALQTNAYGSFSFQIGVAPAFTTIGTFQGIDWVTGDKHLKIDYDPTNTFTFTLSLGVIKFVTVPYAFAAQEVVYIDATGAQNGDALVFNSVTGKFEPTTITSTSVDWSDVLNKPTIDTSFTNELQTLSISNDTLYLTNGGFVKLPASSSSALLPPIATTQVATNIQSFTATLNGTVNANGLSSTVIFEWGLTTAYGNNATATQSPVTGTSVVAVGATLTGLQSSTTYYYRIKATNAVDVTYSSNMSFTTSMSAPQLSTNAVTDILAFTATSGGNITYDGGSPVTARGICYSTSPNPTTANSIIPSGTGSGTFVSNLTGLTHATLYYVRAYATNSVGTSYGNELTFTTQTIYIITEDFSTTVINNPISINGWQTQATAGTKNWVGQEYTGNKYAEMSAYQSGEVSNITWLISPAINLTGYTGYNLNFKTQFSFWTHNAVTVYISTDFNGINVNTATWIPITDAYVATDIDGYNNWIPSGNANLNSYAGNTVYIGFKYEGSGTNSLTSSYRVDDFNVFGGN